MIDRPTTTLFLLASLDGKISTGSTDSMDVDADFPLLPGICEGLGQYYEIEQTTDLWSLNSGRVQAKLGVNEKPFPEKTAVSFVLMDNTHLTAHGVESFCARSRLFVLITSNPNHPAFQVQARNLRILYQQSPDLPGAFHVLKSRYGCERLTLQTGGTLNAALLRAGLIDHVDLIVAPALIGGRDTATIVDGASLTDPSQLGMIRPLRLVSIEAMEHSYVRLRYDVLH